MTTTPLWLARFVRPAVISQNAAFRIVSATDATDGKLCVVVALEPRSQLELGRKALERLFHAHREPPYPVIVRALELAERDGVPHVVFDFPGRLDLDALLQIGADAGYRSSYAASDGFSISLRDALFASATRWDEERGRPMCLGPIALANVLFAADGSWALIGLGHNVVVHDEQGRVVVRNRFYQAPEIALGATPTRESDFIGLIEMTRSMMSFVKIAPAIGRVILGNSVSEDLELFRLIQWFEAHVMRAAPPLRPPIPRIIEVSNRIRQIVGCEPDAAAFKSFVGQLLAAERPDLFELGQVLRVGDDGQWFQRGGGECVDLARSPLQQRLLWRLVRARLDHAGHPLTADELVEALWPGEKIIRESAMNRLYVAINNVRRAGLGDLLERTPAGYRLRPDIHLELASGVPAEATRPPTP